MKTNSIRLVKTFEEENNFNNVIVPLTIDIDEVVFVYHHKVEDKLINECKKVIKKYKNIENSLDLYTHCVYNILVIKQRKVPHKPERK